MGRKKQTAHISLQDTNGISWGKLVRTSLLLTLRIGTGLDSMQQLHVADIVNVDFLFKNDDQSPPVQLYAKDGSGEEQFADSRLSLGIDDLEPPRTRIRLVRIRRSDERDQRGTEEHLDDRRRPDVLGIDAPVRLGVPDRIAFSRADRDAGGILVEADAEESRGGLLLSCSE